MARKKKVEVDSLMVVDYSGSMNENGKRQAAAKQIEEQHSEIAKMENVKSFSYVAFGSEIETKLAFANPKNANLPKFFPNMGSTALIDAMWAGLDLLESRNKDRAKLLMIETDGEENTSRKHNTAQLKDRILRLNKTGKWTIIFNGVGNNVHEFANSIGLDAQNVLSIDNSANGFQFLGQANTGALRDLSAEYASGQTATRGFYRQVDMAGVKTSDVKQDLVDVTDQYDIWDVKNEMRISEFVEKVVGETWNPKENRGFYELSKGEKCVQDYKAILLQDMKTGKLFTGPQARTILGLGNVNEAVKPGDMGTWRVFVLSTSWTRNLKPNTKFAFRKQTATA